MLWRGAKCFILTICFCFKDVHVFTKSEKKNNKSGLQSLVEMVKYKCKSENIKTLTQLCVLFISYLGWWKRNPCENIAKNSSCDFRIFCAAFSFESDCVAFYKLIFIGYHQKSTFSGFSFPNYYARFLFCLWIIVF